MFNRKHIFLTIILSAFFSFAQAQFGGPSQNVDVELIPEVLSVQPGMTFSIALKMQMAPGWHTYWRNGADSGLPTEIKWQLPEGFSAGEIQWPYPDRIDTPPLVSYGYHGEIFLLTQITVAENITVGQEINIAARVSWLECEDVCIPGMADVSLNLPVSETARINESMLEKFARSRALLPLEKSEWQFAALETDSTLIVQAKAPSWFSGTIEDAAFYPFEFGVIEYAAEQKSTFENGILTLTLKRPVDSQPMKIEGILVSKSGWRGPDSEKAHYIDAVKGQLFAASSASKSAIGNIFVALIFSFLGGIILNLMPCVLPVLSLKIMGFVQQASQDKSQAWKHGALFALGVLASFWTLAAILIILRAGGEQIGWGFQLQEPVFLIILSAFLFLFGLSMFGVFEIGTSLTTIEGKTSKKSGWAGSFVSGIMATVVATPCTAPFMGSALGFALVQPAWVSMAIFTFLALGMAFPYVLLASVPALLKFVPKPGRWMESMKQFMGFLLVATVIWLLWVLGLQVGANMVIAVLAALLLMSIAGWIFGRWGNLAMPKRTRLIAATLALLLTASSLYASIQSLDTLKMTASTEQAAHSEGIVWQNYSEKLLTELIESGRPVFIDFTAAWCLSCQVNEKITFSSEEVLQKIKDLNIATIKGDWTSRDENITRALAGFGRNSVPLYVFYPGNGQEPLLLPELITPGIVLDFFARVPGQQPLTVN